MVRYRTKWAPSGLNISRSPGDTTRPSVGPPRGALWCWRAVALLEHMQERPLAPLRPASLFLPTLNRHPAIKRLVLVVDDEPAVRDVVARMLRDAGYATIELADGLEACNYLERTDAPLDAIISDEVMPRLRGSELVAKLKDSRPELPIVLMSASSIDDLRARGLDQRPVALLTKPFNQDRLVSIMQALLQADAAN